MLYFRYLKIEKNILNHSYDFIIKSGLFGLCRIWHYLSISLYRHFFKRPIYLDYDHFHSYLFYLFIDYVWIIGVCISAVIVVVVLATIFIYAYLKWRKENLKTYPSAGRKKGGKRGKRIPFPL